MINDQDVLVGHLSDPHLRPPDDGLAWRDFTNKRLLSLLSWRRRRRHHHRPETLDAVIRDIASQRPDITAITGDLTNFGLPREYERAAAWLRDFPTRAVVIPGNHDAMVSIPWGKGPASWHQWMRANGEEDFPVVTRVGQVALIGVNTGVPTLPFMATGKVGHEQNLRLRKCLTDLGAQGLCRIVMIHHPPVHGLVVRRKALSDLVQVAQSIASSGAELVLHGHSHETSWSMINGTDIPVQGIASASLGSSRARRQAAWNLIRVHRAHAAWEISIETRTPLATGGIETASRKITRRYSPGIDREIVHAGVASTGDTSPV